MSGFRSRAVKGNVFDMKTDSEEGPHTVKRDFREETVARQSSATETTQLSLSKESCEELREERFDETGNFVGATLREA